METGAPVHFFRQGTRGAYVACAANCDTWQAVSVRCPACGARYIASVEKRAAHHHAAAVAAYPDVAGQILLAANVLARECPDHGYRVRVRAFSVVGW